MLMVENFTEVEEDSKQSDEIALLSDSRFEQNLKNNLERLMVEPPANTIKQILEYSKSISK